ncbi:tetratricopeptide repeat protein [Pleionea sp. CnH1-48]|uniref:tetratricopeptide repeat protein n=1 Tax=Pleionea sp. CnH1-48 TaxID=2954494 RepID=UPI002097968C|nr:tetratricopeptide repeat protein [Pleionea sp. CnH1-48]MCO7223069.1 tetratricopeptide repeat protein [Pleionea sp. CnH1-48]
MTSPLRLAALFTLSIILAGCATKSTEPEAETIPPEAETTTPTDGTVAPPPVDVAKLYPLTPEPVLPEPLVNELKKAQALAEQKEYAQANTLLESLRTQYAQYPHIDLNLALMEVQQKNYEQARTHVEKAVTVDSQYAPSLNLAGFIYRHLGLFAEAKQVYEQAIAANPGFKSSYLNLGVLADLYLQDGPLALNSFETFQLINGAEDAQVKNWIVELKRRLPQAEAAQ